MKHFKFILLAAIAVMAGFTSCSDDDDWDTRGDGKVEFPTSNRAFILNEGSMNKNNSNLIYFDWSTWAFNTSCIYTQQNSRQLGDTGNDIIVLDEGNRMAVAVNVSNYITLLDGYGVEQDRLSFEQYPNLGQVRCITQAGSMLYATSYGGYVSRIRIYGDRLQYVDSLKLDNRPEDVAYYGGKLYVTIQGDYPTYDNRMAIIDGDFQTVNYATIMQDPNKVIVDNGVIYVTGFGAAYDNPWGTFDPRTNTYTERSHASAVAFSNGVAYEANSTTDWSTYATTTTYDVLNTTTWTKDDSFFKNMPSELATTSVYSISVNPFTGDIFLGTSDYRTDGKLYVFDRAGNFQRQVSSYGLNPHAVVFLR